jgi:Flp pilus assembly protein TadD
MAVEYAREKVECRKLLGALYILRGKFEEAANEFQIAIHLCQDYLEAWNGAAFALFQLGEFAKAEQKYAHLVQHKPKDPYIYYNYGIVLKELGKKSEALKQLKVAQKLGAENGEVLLHIVSILKDLGEQAQAREVLVKAKAKLPKDNPQLIKLLNELDMMSGV